MCTLMSSSKVGLKNQNHGCLLKPIEQGFSSNLLRKTQSKALANQGILHQEYIIIIIILLCTLDYIYLGFAGFIDSIEEN